MNKLLAMGLCVMMCLTFVLAGCAKKEEGVPKDSPKATEKPAAVETSNLNKDGLPIVNEKVTLKFVAPKAPLAPNYGEMEIFKRLEKDSNVHIEWNNIPAEGYDEKRNLLLAGNDLPDAFYDARFSDHDIITYGASGALIPLEDLIEAYAPNLKKIFETTPALKSIVTAPDGHIYSLPRAVEMGLIKVPFFTSINTKWLNELGLKMPTTLDEYKEVLVAFKTKDPNKNKKADEIPFSFMNNQWCMDIADLIFGAFNMPDNPDHRIVRDGKVIFTGVQQEYKDAISYFNEWYKAGLVDPESFTQDASKFLAKGKTTDQTLGSYIWWETEEVVGSDRSKDYALMGPLKGPNGHQVVGQSNYSEYGRAAFAITSANKNPEITMRWVDQLYAPEMSAQIEWGPIGIIYEKDANGKLVNMPLPEGTSMGEFRQTVAPGGVAIVLAKDFETVVDMEPRAKQRLVDIQKTYAPYMEQENYPQIFFAPEDLEQINTMEVDIKDYVNQMRAKWIVDGGIEKDWDGYVAKLNDMGLDKLMKIYQDSLDRFNANK